MSILSGYALEIDGLIDISSMIFGFVFSIIKICKPSRIFVICCVISLKYYYELSNWLSLYLSDKYPFSFKQIIQIH